MTGDAYIAEHQHKRLFVKRNSSPFLAVLSAEGIVPKLVWTKRMENGDVLTAQEWLEGRELKPEEMQWERVADLLYKIHHSSELLHMLMRLGKKAVTSDESFIDIQQRSARHQLSSTYKEVKTAIRILEELLPATRQQKQVVCHCDLNHNNLILTNNDDLYLVDWDNAMIADPAIDFGMVLKRYIPQKDWPDWLKRYGVSQTKDLLKRMYWYLILDGLYYMNWHIERGERAKAAERLDDLNMLNDYVLLSIL